MAGSPTLQLRSTPLLDQGGVKYPQAGRALPASQNYPDARMLNDYDWGGYLINELYPRKVFIDGRSDFYGDELMRDFRTVISVSPGWEDVLTEVRHRSHANQGGVPLSHRLDAEPDSWVRVFTGEYEVVFARADIAKP